MDTKLGNRARSEDPIGKWKKKLCPIETLYNFGLFIASREQPV